MGQTKAGRGPYKPAMPEPAPRLFWFRRDLRLADHPGLAAALAGGGPLLPVFVLDPETEAFGAASRWRLGRALDALSGRLEAAGSKLVLHRGAAPEALVRLARDVGARAVHWTRLYAPDTVARDTAVKVALRAEGIDAVSHPGFLLHEPWQHETAAGGPFKVFTPFWTAMRAREVPDPLPAPEKLPAPARWPTSDALDDWRLDAAMDRGGAVVARHAEVGEAAAAARLRRFLDGPIAAYHRDRDRPDRAGTSRVSENLTWGEMSPRTLWHAGARACAEGAPGRRDVLEGDRLARVRLAPCLAYPAPAVRQLARGMGPLSLARRQPRRRALAPGLTGEPLVEPACARCT